MNYVKTFAIGAILVLSACSDKLPEIKVDINAKKIISCVNSRCSELPFIHDSIALIIKPDKPDTIFTFDTLLYQRNTSKYETSILKLKSSIKLYPRDSTYQDYITGNVIRYNCETYTAYCDARLKTNGEMFVGCRNVKDIPSYAVKSTHDDKLVMKVEYYDKETWSYMHDSTDFELIKTRHAKINLDSISRYIEIHKYEVFVEADALDTLYSIMLVPQDTIKCLKFQDFDIVKKRKEL